MSMGSQTIAMSYELNDEEVDQVLINELQEYIKLLLEFLSDPEHYEEEERQKTIEDVVHLKAVLRMYMDRTEYKEFIEEIEK